MRIVTSAIGSGCWKADPKTHTLNQVNFMDQKTKSEATSAPEARVTDRAAQAAHETVDRVAEHARSAEDRLRESASHASEQARASAEQARERGREYADTVQGFVRARPLTALGIAFAAGCLIAHLGRR